MPLELLKRVGKDTEIPDAVILFHTSDTLLRIYIFAHDGGHGILTGKISLCFQTGRPVSGLNVTDQLAVSYLYSWFIVIFEPSSAVLFLTDS